VRQKRQPTLVLPKCRLTEAVFQLCFSIWLYIQLDVSNLALVLIINFFIFIQQQLAGADGTLFPALRQYLFVACNAVRQFSIRSS
jgi:hypothetical protein